MVRKPSGAFSADQYVPGGLSLGFVADLAKTQQAQAGANFQSD
jgi:hypothetical protein